MCVFFFFHGGNANVHYHGYAIPFNVSLIDIQLLTIELTFPARVFSMFDCENPDVNPGIDDKYICLPLPLLVLENENQHPIKFNDEKEGYASVIGYCSDEVWVF